MDSFRLSSILRRSLQDGLGLAKGNAMETNILNIVTERLNALIQLRERFQARYDYQASEFLDGLPGLFRLFHWLTFDLDLAPEQRRKAASIAIYIAEPHDFCGESNLGVEGLIDDLWVAYTGLHQMANTIPVDLLKRHWRSEIDIFHLLDLSRNIQDIERHVPSRVLELLKTFMV